MNATATHSSEDNRQKDEDNVVTLLDVLEEENELEEDANAVLGGVDDKICTYSKGYLFRQPLYACATCNSPGNDKPAGICLACSYHCHEGHELIELYTKRNFRCDCGNSCFPSTKCNLEPVKDEINFSNIYNQNFLGTYCTCKRPYPDPEDTVDDEMIQCVICEDWFHKRHLGLGSKTSVDFGEMICQGCMANHLFLWKYSSLCMKPKERESEDESLNVSVSESTGNGFEEEGKQEQEQEQEQELELEQERERGKGQEKEKKVGGGCCMARSLQEVGTGATFWPDGWRKHLCTCEDCIALYEREKVTFLLNDTDTVQYYEKRNKELVKDAQVESQNEKVMKALSSLDRVKQVEVIEGYNRMKTELMDYLQKFADNRKVVREEDIREFFSQMQARKKHKVEVPYFCH